MKIFLKSILTNPNEIIFLASQYLELKDLIDKFIIIEPEFTHTGKSRNMVGIDKLLEICDDLNQKLEYIPLPFLKNVIHNSKDSHHNHKNEMITRGSFKDFIDLSPRDIVISTDADEILYEDYVERALKRLRNSPNPFYAETPYLHQFIYKDNFLAANFSFRGPSIIRAARYIFFNYPKHWRYSGRVINELGGCHFSWCMPLDSLIEKASISAHNQLFIESCESSIRQRILDDIEEKVYSFRKNKLHLLNINNPEKIWPQKYSMVKKIMPSE